jgi:hypothetical protein
VARGAPQRSTVRPEPVEQQRSEDVLMSSANTSGGSASEEIEDLQPLCFHDHGF